MAVFPVHNEPLFSKADLRMLLSHQQSEILSAIESYGQNELLNTAPQDLVTYFVDRFALEPIVLQADKVTVDQAESKLDVGRHHHRWGSDDGGPCYVPSTLLTFNVPFEGTRDLFTFRASMRSSNPPCAGLGADCLMIAFHATDAIGGEPVKKEFEAVLANIRQHASWVNRDVEAYNNELPQKASEAIEKRRARLLQSQSMVASLGYPLRRREDAPSTYTVPAVRKKVAPRPPVASTEPFVAEPVLGMSEYEQILEVVQNMVHVMERSPSSFAAMQEEQLRDHFLVQLNGQFDGATGETFNYEGKTDILVRDRSRNLFIGECKFWKGAASLDGALSQVLSYASWRDTKVAVLLFNRGQDFSHVIEQISGIMQAHAQYKREVKRLDETRFRGVFRHKDDANREMIVTVAAFNIPHATREAQEKKVLAKRRKKDLV